MATPVVYEGELRQQELEENDSDQYIPPQKKQARIEQSIENDDAKRIRRRPHYKKVRDGMMTW